MMLSVGWGLGAAVVWGTADFCAQRAATELGFWPTIWGMNAIGALALGAAWGGGAFSVGGAHWGMLAALGAGNALGGLFFYYALQYGPLTVVSPITAAYPVISALLAYLFTGERLGALLALAVGGVIAGTLLASMAAPGSTVDHPRRRSALTAAVAGALTFGVVFFGLAAAAGSNSTAAPVLAFRLVGAAVLALPLLAGARLPAAMFRCRWLWATGLLDSSAYLLYAAGARHLPVAVISSLSGLFTVWTLVLAIIFLRERLAGRQWLGVALLLGAIGVLALQ